jgi:predicted nuclease with TOPRIM domain
MSLAGKVFAVISFILAIFYVGITSALVSQQENFKEKYNKEVAARANDNKVAEQKQKELDDEIKRLTGEKDTLQKKYAATQGENANLLSEWAAIKDSLRFAMTVINDQEEQIARQQDYLDKARADLKAKGDTNDGLREQIAELKAKYAELQKDRDEKVDKLVVCRKELSNLAKSSETLTEEYARVNQICVKLKRKYPDIYQEMIGPSDEVAELPTIRGKVTAVDTKLGLVVINAGQHQGSKKGIPFIVFRGDKYVGKVVVDEVFPDVSACFYVRDVMQGDPEVGDDVTTKLAIEF